MTAFVVFIKTYAIWIYILSGVGVLVAAKMLIDARRLARTTLFSLDQERAGEQYYRGIALIAILILAACSVTGINLFVSSALPSPEPPIARAVSPTFVITIPNNTSVPPTIISSATKAIDASPISVPTSVPVIATRTLTKAPPSLSPTTVFALPPPVLTYERNKDPLFNGVVVTGEGQMRTALIFKWDWICDQCFLGPSDKFVVAISYIDKLSGLPKTFGGSTQQKMLTLSEILGGAGGEHYQKAKEDLYSWYVQVKRLPNDQPISAPSETWKFTWH